MSGDAGDEDAARAQIGESVLVIELDRRVIGGVADQGEEAARLAFTLEFARQFAEEGVREIGHEKADQIGTPRHQRARQRVAPIAEPGDGVRDARLGLGSDGARAVIQHVAHHRRRGAGQPGDVGEGGAAGAFCHRQPPFACSQHIGKHQRYIDIAIS